MKKIIQVYIHKGEKYYVAECLDLPVVTQGKTLDELAINLKEAIALQLEGEDLTNFDLAPQPSILANLEIDSLLKAIYRQALRYISDEELKSHFYNK